MPRALAAYLQDIVDAASAIEDIMRGVSLDSYRSTRAIGSSVEREFIIIGEALRRISALDEKLFGSISNSRTIVDFRNLLAHDYGAIDDDSACGLVYSDLIVLQAEVEELLHKLTSVTNTAMHLNRHRRMSSPLCSLLLQLSAGR